ASSRCATRRSPNASCSRPPVALPQSQPLKTAFGLLAWALSLLPLAAGAADLLDILRRAQANDAAYAAARASWQAAQERIPQGLAGLLPNASVSANTQYNDRDLEFRNGVDASGRFNNNAITVQIAQPIYRLQNKIQYDQAKVQVAQADYQLSAALQDLILRVAQAYFDILLAQDNVELARAQKRAIGEQLAQAKRNFEVGTATITDTHEAQARYDLVTAQEIAALNDLELRRRALQQIIGTEPPPISPLGPDFALVPPEPSSMETWVETAVGASLEV